ncbi:hypothetical protein I3760_02G069100 [Carya illinoinensis]|nr:hypothetical protein I3760_02G069100 [Carya illinoinensis]
MFGTENPRMIDEHSEFPLIYDFDRSKSFDLGFDVCSWISLVLVLKEYRDRYYVSCMILGRFAQESVNSLELRIQDQDSWVSFAPTVDFDHARMDMNCPLPCPPLDEEALFGRTEIDILKFFDDIDDDGNIIDKTEPRRPGKQMRRVIEVLKPIWERCALPIHEPSALPKKEKTKRHAGKDMEKLMRLRKIVTTPNREILSEAEPNDKSKNTSNTDSNHPESKLESSTGTLRQAYDHENIENAKKEKAIQSTDHFESAPMSEKCPDHQKPRLLKEVVLKENTLKGKNMISEVVPKSSNKSKSTLEDEDLELKLVSTTRKLREAYKDAKKRKIQVIDFQTAPKPEDCRKKPDRSTEFCSRRLAKKPRSCGASWGMQKGT